MAFKVEDIFTTVLNREMKILMEEKSKSCQSGAIIDLAVNRLVETYAMKNHYDELRKSIDYKDSRYLMEKSERERYQAIVEKRNMEDSN